MKEIRYPKFLVVLIIIGLHFAIGINKIIPLRPQSIHQWAQCDRASVALNFYQDNMNIFLPRVHNVDNGTGITGLEFAFVNYCTAFLYQIFGFHEWLYRFVSLFFYSMGLYFAFHIAFRFLNNFLQSLGIMLLFACSPLLAFYSANFLPEPAALGFSLGAWFYLLVFAETLDKKYLRLWTLFLTLSCLIKISCLVNIPAMVLLLVLKNPALKPLKFLKLISISLILIVGLTFSWYAYANYLSVSSHSELFLLHSKFPDSLEIFLSVWREVRTVWFNRLYSDLLILVLLLCVFCGLIFNKTSGKDFYKIVVVLFLSQLVFLFSMWTQLRYHDYYMIPMYPFFLLGMIAAFKLLKSIPGKKFTVALNILLLGTIIFQWYEAKTHLRTCLKKTSWKYSPLYADSYFDMEKILVNCGVQPSDKIISMYDNTPDVSLYLLNRKGVTVSHYNAIPDFEKYLNSGRFKFLVYNAASNLQNVLFDPGKYPLEIVYFSGDLKIYKVKLLNKNLEGDATTPLSLSPWN